MRHRKRTDWPLSVYKYGVQLDSPSWAHLPDAVKQEIAAQRALWNQLVEAFEHRSPHSLLAEVRRLTMACSAPWASKEFIVTQFLAATRRFFRHQSNPPKRKGGIPHEVHFQHRFTSGGLPIARVFKPDQRLTLNPVPAETYNPARSQRHHKRLARTTGVFRVGKVPVAFRLILHRPLPEGAYLKTAALIGRQVLGWGYYHHYGGGHLIPAQWTWSLHLTLEVPPAPLEAQAPTRSRAALQLSYQLWKEEHLRIALLTDSTGREEAVCLPPAILQSWQHKRVLQQQADRLVEDTKARLRQLPWPPTLPTAARRVWGQLGTVQAPGLWRLFHLFEAAQASGDVVDIVRRWADRATRLVREARGLERHYLGHRDWFYHNLALQLCRRYQQLTIEAGDVLLTPDEEQGANLHLWQVATYRHLAAPARFLACLQQAARKTDTEILYKPQAPATRELTPERSVQDPVQRGES